jgi:hypothetical protein
MTELSPESQAVWDAFNDAADRVGVFEDYGDALAAAFRAAADQIQFHDQLGLTAYGGHAQAQQQFLTIASELDGSNG